VACCSGIGWEAYWRSTHEFLSLDSVIMLS
jgi:hypothetical protein